ncbi:MAG: hypothetical protein ABIG29_01135 [Candidatus Nealsonbacteria bacterium]
MKEALCRSDKTHWCTECCPPNCPLLGDIGGGEVGCLGHDGKRTPDGLTERPICLEIDCLDEFLPEDRETIRQAISKLSAGRFEMGKVLAQFKIGRRICAWCKPQRILGRKLDIEGDTHTICDDCCKADPWK